jgi:hypothetical protein
MSKGGENVTAHVGINSKARKIASAYIGVDGKARKVTKAYVGVNGKARIWWKAAPSEATITITNTGGVARDRYVVINGVTYSDAVTVTVPVGAVIACYAQNYDDTSNQDRILLNGETVATAYRGQVATYNYTVVGNANIELSGSRFGAYVYITEL